MPSSYAYKMKIMEHKQSLLAPSTITELIYLQQQKFKSIVMHIMSINIGAVIKIK